MRASDLQIPLPVVRRDTTAGEAARLIADDRLGALVVADDAGRPYAVVAAVDVLSLMLPPYLREDVSLASVYDEQGAEEIWTDVDDRTIGMLLDDDEVQVYRLFDVDADANIAELATLLAEERARIVHVAGSPPDAPRFVTLASVLEAILGFAEGRA